MKLERSKEWWMARARREGDAVIGAGTPCGLAARDSLRLEASMPLYGHELTAEITPVEAGMGRASAKKEADFVGAEVIRKRAEEGPQVVISGLTSDQRRAARAGSCASRQGRQCGQSAMWRAASSAAALSPRPAHASHSVPSAICRLSRRVAISSETPMSVRRSAVVFPAMIVARRVASSSMRGSVVW